MNSKAGSFDDAFDYVIVGSGSAGSVLAARLSEDPKNRVLVLEHGGTDAGPLIQMPAALSYPMNMPRYDWGFVTEPEPHLGGRRLATPRGKVVGGSSSVNGMVYVRGHACDFDTWEELGAAGWGYRHVLPYYRRMEHSHGGQAGWRGSDGPLHVTRGRMENPLYKRFIEAGEEAGYAATEDYNGERQEGFGAMEMTVWRGRRWSAANAYLKPALQRRNLKLKAHAHVRRVIIERGRATGVGVRDRRRGPPRSRQARSHTRRLVDQLAEAPHALRHRPGGAPARARYRGRRRPARRGRQPAGPSRNLPPAEVPPADHALSPLEPLLQGADRPALALVQGRPRRHQSFRVLRFPSAPAPACSTRTSSTTSCRSRCATTERPPPKATAFRPMSGRCARSRGVGCGSLRPSQVPRPRFSSTTCPTKTTGGTSGPASG